jgi:hypothetical protein
MLYIKQSGSDKVLLHCGMVVWVLHKHVIYKTFKKDFKVHKIASSERVNKLMEWALSQNDDKTGSRVEL